MSSNNIFVQDYLSSLREDKELDYLFPRLLILMGYRIVQTAKESKGQSQYGKDIVAIGRDNNGVLHRWYFEIKGFKDRDISDQNYSITDGIRESIIEAKDTAFNDISISNFNDLPIMIVLVHNGVIKANIRPAFDGFIAREFKNGGFERWDIYYLTDLFSRYLFSEYLLIDEDSNRYLKKTLAFLDTPDYDYIDFKRLVVLQFEKINSIKGRALAKLFATLGLLQNLIFHYSKENNNLVPAKECSKFLVLKTWGWILENNLQGKGILLREFQKLLVTQSDIFKAYFKRTLHIAIGKDGLFFESGLFFEYIGYPLRCFDYLDDLIYYFRLRNSLNKNSQIQKRLHVREKDILIELIRNNSGFFRPVIDNQSIVVMQLFIFFTEGNRRQTDVNFISDYIFKLIHGLLVQYLKKQLLPELHNRLDLVVEAYATETKPDEYCDSTSILVAFLLELTAVFNSEAMFNEILEYINLDLSLQIPNVSKQEFDFERLLFERNLHNEYYVESIDRLPDSIKKLKETRDFEAFKKSIREKISTPSEYVTDKTGYGFLRYLAHSYHKNELLPEEWRSLISEAPEEAINLS